MRLIKDIPRDWILDQARGQADRGAHGQQSFTPVDAPVWQDDGIILDIALRMMSIWNIEGQIVELRRADGTDGRRGRVGVGTTAGDRRMT